MGEATTTSGAGPDAVIASFTRGGRPVEELRAELGEVDGQPIGTGKPRRVGNRGRNRLGDVERPRPRLGVADDDADRAHGELATRSATAISRAGR